MNTNESENNSLYAQQPAIILQPVQVLYQGYVMPSEMASEFNLIDLSQYCMCDITQSQPSVNFTPKQEPSETSIVKVPTTRRNKKELFKDLFIKKAKETLALLENLVDKDRIMFKKTSKSAITPGHVPLKPRAKFIGVSKNGNNWQSLIVINNVKVYMGTYKTQKEAATIFDFHSMIVHYKCAKVNYDYSAHQLISMIKVFFENNNEFDASEYFRLYPDALLA